MQLYYTRIINCCGIIYMQLNKFFTGINWDGGQHYYPPPDKVEDLFYWAIDRHNIYMDLVKDMNTEEKVPYIFKCAAWLLFTVVDIHPFVDGNGRLCRLLANYVLSLITPFSVNAYSPSGKDGSG